MFYVTNTAANIALTKCTFTYGSGVFINIGKGSWGSSGSNGGSVTMNLTNQDIVGNIVVDSISGLTLKLVGSSITGTINGDKTACKLSITLDADSKITLTGNSYYTSLSNSDSSSSNIVTGSYTLEKYDESEIPSSGSGSSGTPGPSGTPGNSSNPGPSGTPGNSSSSDTSDDSDEVFDTYSYSKNLNICKSIVYSIVLMLLIFV